MVEINIPRRLRPIVQAFNAANEEAAKALIISAAQALCIKESIFGYSNGEVSDQEIESVLAMMQALAPKDMIEMIYSAQIISFHLSGLSMLGHSHRDDQILGLKLLKFSNEALNQLHKKRSGGTSQNINITYNYTGEGPVLMQKILPKGEICQ